MFKPRTDTGDSIAVPRLVFSKLPEAGEERFRVALYAIEQGGCEAAAVAAALRIPLENAKNALAYWEGAGLLAQDAPLAPPPASSEHKRKHLNTGEVSEGARGDAVLRGMLRELQVKTGGLLNPREGNIFATLYLKDQFPPDLILMAVAHCQETGKPAASRVERMLFGWREKGIDSSEAADAYLKLLEERSRRYEKAMKVFQYSKPKFNKNTCILFDKWFEEYHFDWEMVQAAQMAAGDKSKKIPYIDGILKDWYGKGYHTAADARKGEAGSSTVRAQSLKSTYTKENDPLKNTTFVPLKRKEATRHDP